MWTDLEGVEKTDCPLCAGWGIYEAIFELRPNKYRKHDKMLIATRRYCDEPDRQLIGYRAVCCCHRCVAAEMRGVPNQIGCWEDHQVEELLYRQASNGEAKF